MTLLSLDAVLEICKDDDIESELENLREVMRGVEFFVHNTKASISVSSLSPQLLSPSDDVTLARGDTSELARQISPRLSLYAPIGGLLSKEFRTLLRRGLARHLARVALQRILATDALPDVTVEQVTPSAPAVVSLRWSPHLLEHLIGSSAELGGVGVHFIAQLPVAATLAPLVEDLKAPWMPRADAVDFETRRTYRLRCTLSRLVVGMASAQDQRTAHRLAVTLCNAYLRQAEQLRDAGGDALQRADPRDAADCYTRVLLRAQTGLLYPYKNPLRPPPSLEDRLEDPDEDDMLDDAALALALGDRRRDLTPAHPFLNTLLRLPCAAHTAREGRHSEAEAEAEEALYETSLLTCGRLVFPQSHVLLHVWYALHRMVVVGAANAAHAFLQVVRLTPCMDKKMRQSIARAAEWCKRVLPLLHRVRGWCEGCGATTETMASSPDAVKEYMWWRTMEFKVLLRRARLLCVLGDFDESRRTLLEVETQIRLLSSHPSDSLSGILADATSQLSQEKTLLREEEKKSSSRLVLRL